MKMKKIAIKKFGFYIAGGALLILLAAWAAVVFVQQKSDAPAPAQRWYTAAQVSAGEGVYIANCLVCHGAEGSGTANWRQRQADGSFPPPPLNGTAHTWHHPMAALRQTIKNGGIPLGGKMPAFGGQLSDEEIDSVLAYIQSLWQEDIYQIWWNKINARE